jgi:hypothetical protein
MFGVPKLYLLNKCIKICFFHLSNVESYRLFWFPSTILATVLMTVATRGSISTVQLVIGQEVPVCHRGVHTHTHTHTHTHGEHVHPARQHSSTLLTTKSSVLYQCLMFMLGSVTWPCMFTDKANYPKVYICLKILYNHSFCTLLFVLIWKYFFNTCA